MANETLSQTEIDALLGNSKLGSLPATPKALVAADPNVQLYDFRRPHRISTDKLGTLKAIYERLAKSLEGWLLSRVRSDVQLTLQSVEQFSFGEFTLSLPTPCASFTFECRNTGGQEGVIDFGHEVAFFVVDRLFGGGTDVAILDRPLTPIERMGVRSVAERAMALLSDAWHEYVELDLELNGFESVPEMLRIANREDPVLVANIEVTVGSTRSLILLCLPFAVFEKFFAGATERRVAVIGSPEEVVKNRRVAEQALRSTRIAVSARLPEFRMSLRDLLALRGGSVLSTGVPRGAELDVLVGAQPRFRGAPGRVGPALAVRLTDDIQPAPETVTISSTRQHEVANVRRRHA